MIALVWSLVAGVAMAEPGQCKVSGFGAFDCDLARDGSGLTFAFPDGHVFAFALVGEGEGLAYLSPADVAPGAYPTELGRMMPASDAPGCWVGGKGGFVFCVQVAQ
ncbi:MAG: hypothetical protein MO852_16210 [Candidatus Devosia euplotis]|nr:hypothetical protein [Candidatus Devosia euplotis]